MITKNPNKLSMADLEISKRSKLREITAEKKKNNLGYYLINTIRNRPWVYYWEQAEILRFFVVSEPLKHPHSGWQVIELHPVYSV